MWRSSRTNHSLTGAAVLLLLQLLLQGIAITEAQVNHPIYRRVCRRCCARCCFLRQISVTRRRVLHFYSRDVAICRRAVCVHRISLHLEHN
jgi:hypothetical protein